MGRAERLIAEKPKILISLQESYDLSVQLQDGRNVLLGIKGRSDFDGRTVKIFLNRNLIDFPREEMASVLAHELLGHGLSHLEAEKLGADKIDDNYYDGNETDARLLGWIVMLESGFVPSDPSFWKYLDSPARYSREIALSPLYVLMLNAAEMADPVAAYQRHLELVKLEPAGDDQKRDNLKVDQNELEGRLQALAGPDGPGLVAEFVSASGNPYFQHAAQDLQSDARRLSFLDDVLRPAPSAAPAAPAAPPASIALDELKRLFDPPRPSL